MLFSFVVSFFHANAVGPGLFRLFLKVWKGCGGPVLWTGAHR